MVLLSSRFGNGALTSHKGSERLRLVKELKFTLEIDVASEEGVPKSTLVNKIKETVRQIGAIVQEERLE